LAFKEEDREDDNLSCKDGIGSNNNLPAIFLIVLLAYLGIIT
jgi:hypothetical protein